MLRQRGPRKKRVLARNDPDESEPDMSWQSNSAKDHFMYSAIRLVFTVFGRIVKPESDRKFYCDQW